MTNETETFGGSEAFPTVEELIRERRGEISVREAVEVLGVTRQRVHEMIRAGILQARTPVRGSRLKLVSAESVAKRLDKVGKRDSKR